MIWCTCTFWKDSYYWVNEYIHHLTYFLLFFFSWKHLNFTLLKISFIMRIPVVAQQKRIWLGTMRLQVWSLASLSGLRIQRCRELWCRLQTWLGSGVAVAVEKAGSYSSHSIPSLGTSMCHRYGPKKKKINKIVKFLATYQALFYIWGIKQFRDSPCPCAVYIPVGDRQFI